MAIRMWNTPELCIPLSLSWSLPAEIDLHPPRMVKRKWMGTSDIECDHLRLQKKEERCLEIFVLSV